MKTSFHSLMFKTYHAQRNKVRTFLPSANLSPGQPKILNYLLDHNQCMQKDIANSCDVEPATVSKLLNAMEQQQLIERRSVEGNRRSGCIFITDKGRMAVSKWNIYCGDVEQISLKDFSDEEKHQFKTYLCRMYANLSGKEIE